MITNNYGNIDIDLLEIKDVIDINFLQTFQDNFDTFRQVDSSLRRNAEGSEFIIKVPVKPLEKEYNVCDKQSGNLNAFVENIKIEFSDIY